MNIRKFVRTTAMWIILAVPGFANAMPVISFNPVPALGNIGDSISVDLVWNGNGANYLGAWDVDIGFDDSIVSFDGATFGTGVDSLGCIAFITCDVASAGGVIDIFETSFDAVVDLISNQDSLANTFTIATLNFTALANGTTDLLFLAGNVFGDESGLAIEPLLTNGQICVGPDGCTVAVAEPAGLPLLLLGLAGIWLSRRKPKKS